MKLQSYYDRAIFISHILERIKNDDIRAEINIGGCMDEKKSSTNELKGRCDGCERIGREYGIREIEIETEDR